MPAKRKATSPKDQSSANLGFEPDIGKEHADTFRRDLHPDLRADYAFQQHILQSLKPKARRGKILFINAVNEVTRERAQSFLTDEHLQRVVRAYQGFKDEPGFTRVVPIVEIRAKEGNLSISLYVGRETQAQSDAATESAITALPCALAGWLKSSARFGAT